MDPSGLTIHEISKKFKKKELTSSEIVRSLIRRIESAESELHAFTTVLKEEALQSAETADQQITSGEAMGALTGIPIALKDNICTKDIPTTCSSAILKNFIPPYHATVVEKLRRAGAIIIGKTNLDEFAMGSSTENSGVGVTRNPWSRDHIPGGSSGGSTVAVAADFCAGALGSDTGGSIRQPAAMCGVVGLKPTYGRVSRYGLVAFASSFDQIGPVAKDVRDAALLLNIISGYDPQDSTSARIVVPDYTEGLNGSLEGLRIGVPKEYFIKGMDPDVDRAVRESIRLMEKLGARSVEIELPHTKYAVAAYYILATAEASSNLARYDGVRYGYRVEGAAGLHQMYNETRKEGFGPEVKRRIMLGTYSLSAGYYDAYYLKAQKVRTLIKKDFDDAFRSVDVIVTPTTPTAAFKIGEKSEDPLQMYLSDIFTISINLAGNPGISIPCGFTSENLPIGLQIVGRPFEENLVLRGAYALEQATEWHQKKPRLTA